MKFATGICIVESLRLESFSRCSCMITSWIRPLTRCLAGLWPSVSGKGRVRSSPYSAKRGDRDAYPTDHDDTALSPVHATVLKECLAACPTACSGCDPRSGQEDCGLHPAGGGFGG